jgi:hypothetical protein
MYHERYEMKILGITLEKSGLHLRLFKHNDKVP